MGIAGSAIRQKTAGYACRPRRHSKLSLRTQAANLLGEFHRFHRAPGGLEIDVGRRQFLQKAQLPAINLFTPGGLSSSPLATYYGINILPTMFLVGKDGRVIDRSLQANDLEAALRKAL